MKDSSCFSVVVTDVDNTLFDWFGVWHDTFRAMLDEIVRVSGVPEMELFPEIREIHREHGTSEYAFLIESMPSLKQRFPNDNLLEKFSPAIKAFRETRRKKTCAL
jgi:phosphoglycolate phosphatase